LSPEVLKKLSGPRPYEPIITSPHRAEIDERLFEQKHSVRSVHKWISEELGVADISYVTLTRYRNAQLNAGRGSDGERRRTEVLRDLKYLGAIVKLGKVTLDAGLAVRPSEAMRAIELRSQLLSTFPDATKERDTRYQALLAQFAEIVREVITEEQRQEIIRLVADSEEMAANNG
jgi:hypothetical protein